MPENNVDLAFAATGEMETLEFPAYAYDHAPSPATGGTYLRFHLDRTEVWRVPRSARSASASARCIQRSSGLSVIPTRSSRGVCR